MRKKIIICALSVLLLILSGVLAFYLHVQNRPIAGLSGDNRTLLRVWMLRTPRRRGAVGGNAAVRLRTAASGRADLPAAGVGG